MTKKHTYLAMSTTNYQTNGMRVLGIAHTRAAAEEAGFDAVQGDNIYDETYRRNMVVVSKTAAIKKGWLSRDDENQFYQMTTDGVVDRR